MHRTDGRFTIVIDLKKNRIRIHKKTLHALGDPESIILIINPSLMTLGIKCGTPDDILAHKVPRSTLKSKNCYELNSKSLISALRSVCPQWEKQSGYRLEGGIVPAQNMVCFQMDTAKRIKEERATDEHHD